MKKVVLITAPAFIFVYFIVFPYRLDREVFFTPIKTINLPAVMNTVAPGDAIGPFKLGPYFGYLDKDLNPVALIRSSDRVTASARYFIRYGTGDQNYDVYAPSLVQTGAFSGTGVPVVLNNAIFLVDAPVGKVVRLSPEGQIVRDFDAGGFITAIAAGSERFIVGSLDGLVSVIKSSGGETPIDLRPEGSRVEAVYGAAISAQDRYVAVVSGLGPQRMTLYKRNSTGYAPIYHQNLATERREVVHVKFSKNERFVYYEEARKLHIVDIKKRTESVIPFSGDLAGILPDALNGAMSFHSKSGNDARLFVFSDNGKYPILRGATTSPAISFAGMESMLLIGVGDTLAIARHDDGVLE